VGISQRQAREESERSVERGELLQEVGRFRFIVRPRPFAQYPQ
jgi:hypothetical protein